MTISYLSSADSPSAFQRLLDVADDGLIALDAQGRIAVANRAFRALCGHDPAGLALADMITAASRDGLQQSLRSLTDGAERSGPVALELQTRAATRFDLWIERAEAGGYVARARPSRVSSAAVAATELMRQPELDSLWQNDHLVLAISELPERRFLAVNRAFERVAGVGTSEARGKTAQELGFSTAFEQASNDRSGELELIALQTPIGPHQLILTEVPVTNRDAALTLTLGIDITEYADAAARGRESDERLRALYDNLDDAIYFFDEQARFFDVNSAACKQLGYTRDELLKLSVPDIVALPGFNAERAAAQFANKKQLRIESFHRAKSGKIHPVEVTLCHIVHKGRRAVAAISRDMSDRRRIEADIRDARDRLQAILQTLPDLLFELDENGVILDYYSSRSDLLTMPFSEFIHKNLQSLSTPEVAAEVMHAIRTALRDGFSTGTELKTRTERWFELSLARRTGTPGTPGRVIALARDTTERKQREHELQHKNDELLRFTYTVSHDLKSPLVTIRCFIDMLRKDLAAGDTVRVHRDLDFMERAAVRMHQLLDDLLLLSRAGRQVAPPERLSLQELVRDVCELLAGAISATGAQVEVTPSPTWLMGEHTRLTEVFQNLIENAIKFAKPGETPRVSVRVEPGSRQNELVVCVRDEGVGIDPRFKHRLFGLFEKLHPEAGGTGIGLAVVKRIIEVHGGRIWIDSEGVGLGTSVRFSLPNITQESAA